MDLSKGFVVEVVRAFVCRGLLNPHLGHPGGSCVDSCSKAADLVLVCGHHRHLSAALSASVDQRINLHMLVVVDIWLSIH